MGCPILNALFAFSVGEQEGGNLRGGRLQVAHPNS